MSGTRQRKHVTKGEKKFLSVPDGTWIPMSMDMLASPAWRALSRAAMQLISRLCIENCVHAGRENGRLAVGYDAFEQYGIDRHAIKRAIEEAAALGFLRVTGLGRRAYGADPGRRATYRLTFVGTVGDNAGPATDDWRKITEAEAMEIASTAKASVRRAKRDDGDSQPISNKQWVNPHWA